MTSIPLIQAWTLTPSSSFSTLATDMRGFAQVPKGSRGLCTNTFDFTGIQGQSYYSLALPGPREGPFTLSADPDVVSWSPCGGTSAIMNMNTQCNISPTRDQALIAAGPPPTPFTFALGIKTWFLTGCHRSIASAAR
jgi:hypothetical protein